MNETEYVFMAIIAFGVGYATAYFYKNIGRLWRSWGLFVCYFLFPPIVIGLLVSAAVVADTKDAVISSMFAGGFVIRMVKHDV